MPNAVTLIAEEKLESGSQSSIVHYRAALNCLRELPRVHRERMGLNLDASFKHPSNVPTTPEEFKICSSVVL